MKCLVVSDDHIMEEKLTNALQFCTVSITKSQISREGACMALKCRQSRRMEMERLLHLLKD